MPQARTTVENVAAEEAQGHVATWKRAELVWVADEKHGHPPSLRFAVGGGAAVVETPGMSAASWRALAAAVASPSRSLVAREAGEGWPSASPAARRSSNSSGARRRRPSLSRTPRRPSRRRPASLRTGCSSGQALFFDAHSYPGRRDSTGGGLPRLRQTVAPAGRPNGGARRTTSSSWFLRESAVKLSCPPAGEGAPLG